MRGRLALVAFFVVAGLSLPLGGAPATTHAAATDQRSRTHEAAVQNSIASSDAMTVTNSLGLTAELAGDFCADGHCGEGCGSE